MYCGSDDRSSRAERTVFRPVEGASRCRSRAVEYNASFHRLHRQSQARLPHLSGMSAHSSSDIEPLLDALHEEFGDAVRSCVECLPRSKTIHCLRVDLDRTLADQRLIRIEELSRAERLTSTPITADTELTSLDASIHLAGDVIVVHLIDPVGREVGFSVDADALPELPTLVTQWVATTVEADGPSSQ